MEAADTCLCDKSSIDRSFLVLETLKGGTLYHIPIPYMATQVKIPMVNRAKIYGHIEKTDLFVLVSRSDNFKKCPAIFKYFTRS